uniref:Ribonuclease H protein At1g65750 family n=1 Tax=Cajanus cajan TaxID=3821 RepID=A0A151R6U6_CAJCA|nr:Putative ribonuclease H protein At1g65750 family [Cajanus cajan]
MVGRNKRAVFSYVKDRIWKKINHWTGKHLSKVGRETLIKSVAQAIPTYCMSTFLLPTSLEDEIQRMLNSFWWGSNHHTGRGIKWLSWDKLTMRKEYGGMGFRHLHGFNLAMLGKQGWCIGDGSSINIWKDPWLRNSHSSFVTSIAPQGYESLTVHDLIDHTLHKWDSYRVHSLFNDQDSQTILAMPLLNPSRPDSLAWRLNTNGSYSVRTAYHHLMEHVISNNTLRVQGDWMNLWNLKIPHSTQIFLWRLMRGCIPTRLNLQQKGVPCTSFCAHCSANQENE